MNWGYKMDDLELDNGPELDTDSDTLTEQDEWQIAEAMAAKAESQSEQMSVTGQAVNIELQDVLTPMLIAVFGVLAPAWKVTQGECSALGQAYADVINYYFPDATASPGMVVIGAALATTGAVIMPRMAEGIPRKTNEKEVQS